MTSTLGRNYARALFELARETGTLDAVEDDLHGVRDALHTEREARNFLANRLIGRATKKSLIRESFEGKVDPQVLTLLFLLVDRGRTLLIGEVVEELERLSRLARGVRKVTVFSAFPLGEDEKKRITGALEKRFSATVELTTEIRTSLIGGVVAESEGQEIEFSIEGRLKELASSAAAGGAFAAGGSGFAAGGGLPQPGTDR
jgi:F-type H+-transporting ATPase subunit delta